MAGTPTGPSAVGGSLSRRARPSRRRLHIGVLVGIILIGAIVAAVWLYPSASTQDQQGVATGRAKCLACQATFDVDPARPDADPTPGRKGSPVPRYTCTHCGAERSALLMIQCPNPKCEKHFLSSQTLYDHKQDLAIRRGRTPRAYDVPPIVCPHCDTDYVAFMQANRGRRNR